MRTIHIAEHCHEGLGDLQMAMMSLQWAMVKETIPYHSAGARTQWALNAHEWLTEHVEDNWTGIAYIDDGVVYVRFETSSDAAMFRTVILSQGL